MQAGSTGPIADVTVVARFRPLSERERADDLTNYTLLSPCEVEVQGTAVALDRVLGTDATQSEVYECVGRTAVTAALSGRCAIVFAYGAPGSGKAYNVRGRAGEERGLIPRITEEIFAANASDRDDVHVSCSFVEVHLEGTKDLLAPAAKVTAVGTVGRSGMAAARATSPGRLSATAGAESAAAPVERHVPNEKAVETLVAQGLIKVADLRSHTVLTYNIDRAARSGRPARSGRLYVVDLGYVDRGASARAAGEEAKHVALISSALLTLGQCLASAATGDPRRPPTKDSRLTTYISDCFTAGSHISFLATLSPSSVEETVATLKFADRIKFLEKPTSRAQLKEPRSARPATPVRKVPSASSSPQGSPPGSALPPREALSLQDDSSAALAKLKAENADLRAENVSLRAQLDKSPAKGGQTGCSADVLHRVLAEVERRFAQEIGAPAPSPVPAQLTQQAQGQNAFVDVQLRKEVDSLRKTVAALQRLVADMQRQLTERQHEIPLPAQSMHSARTLSLTSSVKLPATMTSVKGGMFPMRDGSQTLMRSFGTADFEGAGELEPTLSGDEMARLKSQTSLSPSELEELHRCFLKLDTRGSGELDQAEFGKLFDMLPVLKNVSHDNKDLFFSAFDLNHSGTIDFTEIAIALSVLSKGTLEDKLRFLFTVYDTDKADMLNKEGVEKILMQMFSVTSAMGTGSQQRMQAVMEAMTSKIDENGFINLEEWIDLGKHTPMLLLYLGIAEKNDLQELIDAI